MTAESVRVDRMMRDIVHDDLMTTESVRVDRMMRDIVHDDLTVIEVVHVDQTKVVIEQLRKRNTALVDLTITDLETTMYMHHDLLTEKMKMIANVL
jgi:hypothetical protein